MVLVRSWPVTFATAVVTAAVLIGAGLLVTGGKRDDGAQAASGPTPAQQAAAAAAATAAITPNGPANIGPENVPLVTAAPLGPASSPRPGHAPGRRARAVGAGVCSPVGALGGL